MSEHYKNNSERYAYFMVLEGAAILLLVGLFSFDARVQNYLFGTRAASVPVSQRIDVRKIDTDSKPFFQFQQNAAESSSHDATESKSTPVRIDLSDPNSELYLEEQEPSTELSEIDFGDAPDEPELDQEFEEEASLDQFLATVEGTSIGNHKTQLHQPVIEVEPSIALPGDLPRQELPDESGEEMQGAIIPDVDKLEAADLSIVPEQLSTQSFADHRFDKPNWWLNHYEDLLLPGRDPIRASLDEVIAVAIQNSPDLEILGANLACHASNLTMASNVDAMASRSISEMQSTIVQVVSAYWDVYLARVRLIQNRRHVSRAVALKAQLTADEHEDFSEQILNANTAIAARRSDVIRSEFELLKAQDSLNHLTMGAAASNAKNVELIPDVISLPDKIQLSQEHLIKVAKANRPEIREALANIRAAIEDQSSSSTSRWGFPESGDQIKRKQLVIQRGETKLRKTVSDVVLDVRLAARRVLRLNQEMQSDLETLQQVTAEISRSVSTISIKNRLAVQDRLAKAEAKLAKTNREQAVALVDLKRATGELLHSDKLDYCSTPIAVPLSVVLPKPPPIVPSTDQANDVDFRPRTTGVISKISDTPAAFDDIENDFDPSSN